MNRRQRRQCTLSIGLDHRDTWMRIYILIKLSFVNAVLPSKWNSTVILSW